MTTPEDGKSATRQTSILLDAYLTNLTARNSLEGIFSQNNDITDLIASNRFEENEALEDLQKYADQARIDNMGLTPSRIAMRDATMHTSALLSANEE